MWLIGNKHEDSVFKLFTKTLIPPKVPQHLTYLITVTSEEMLGKYKTTAL